MLHNGFDADLVNLISSKVLIRDKNHHRLIVGSLTEGLFSNCILSLKMCPHFYSYPQSVCDISFHLLLDMIGGLNYTTVFLSDDKHHH